jgi:23S rRNA pseudouridine1911/1915/1917 synthase
MKSPELIHPEIIYEDRQVLVVTKPNGWVSQADGYDRQDILEWSRRHISEKRAKGGRPFVGLCHRLDRQVGGLMVVAKTSKAAARISSQFRERSVTKYYTAICLGRPQMTSAELAQSLIRDGCVTRLARNHELGTECLLRYSVTDSGTVYNVPVSQLKVELVTGFKHQIRAQLASIDHPIYGDSHYGAPKVAQDIAAIGLCSSSLSFTHPIGRNVLNFECSLDNFWPFADFKPGSPGPG